MPGVIHIGAAVLCRAGSAGENRNVPQAADFRRGDGQGVERRVIEDAKRHFAGAEAAHEVEDGRQTVVIVEAGLALKRLHTRFAVDGGVGRRIVVERAAKLVEHGVIRREIRGGNVGVGDADGHVRPLNGGQHGNQIIPRFRDGQPVFFQNVAAVEENRAQLRLRQLNEISLNSIFSVPGLHPRLPLLSGVQTAVEAERGVGAGVELVEDFLQIIELRQILHRVAKRVVDGVPAVG